ncbi:DoxX family protein [Mucilaginibacter sp. KACC 22063]|uniref:DoxX family protein n=1 Tax=Mucilaginibacter sp. KACC 22063 TaxID=3025666 RepID=UPI002365458E|nr:DoxX family protein [Mucilaginibacter sp. KACC 22063]WDF56498.1 DoxX family protein [Mucilaginibacter sp. KACC 22063]
MHKIRKAALIFLIVFYLAAGINHFIHPDGYIRVIPGWLPYPALINTIAGICEIVFALMLIFKSTRKLAGWLIIAMLIFFSPVHIDMIIHAPMKFGNLTVTPLVAWVRILFQPLLMLWAWWASKE